MHGTAARGTLLLSVCLMLLSGAPKGGERRRHKPWQLVLAVAQGASPGGGEVGENVVICHSFHSNPGSSREKSMAEPPPGGCGGGNQCEPAGVEESL